MAIGSDFKLVKEKKLDKETTLVIKRNIMSGRIFVEFTSNSPRIILQKSFQDTYEGKCQSEDFSKSIRNTKELRAYFGLENK